MSSLEQWMVHCCTIIQAWLDNFRRNCWKTLYVHHCPWKACIHSTQVHENSQEVLQLKTQRTTLVTHWFDIFFSLETLELRQSLSVKDVHAPTSHFCSINYPFKFWSPKWNKQDPRRDHASFPAFLPIMCNTMQFRGQTKKWFFTRKRASKLQTWEMIQTI